MSGNLGCKGCPVTTTEGEKVAQELVRLLDEVLAEYRLPFDQEIVTREEPGHTRYPGVFRVYTCRKERRAGYFAVAHLRGGHEARVQEIVAHGDTADQAYEALDKWFAKYDRERITLDVHKRIVDLVEGM